MKKKLIQILMLLVATVSVGSFVSCKDTNEDLYNELRTQNLENATVAEALAARIAALEALVADIKSCECDTTLLLSWVNAEDQYLQDQIDALNTAIEELGKAENYYTKAEIDKMFSDLADLYAKLADFAALKKAFEDHVTQNTIDITLLQEKVKDIEEWKKDIVSCKCDLEKLGILEGRINEAEANAKEALDGLKAIEDIAKDAKSIAENAQTTADQAKILAEEAKTAATEAKTLAEAFKDLYETAANNATEAKTMATEAKTLAEENKGKIEKLEEDLKTLDTKVNTISETANEALSAATAADAKATENKKLIDALTERVATNEANIENLQKSVEKLEDLAEKVGANTEAISTLKDTVKELGDKYDEMKSTLDTVKQQVEDCQKICAANLEAAKAELRLEIQELETELIKEISANSQAIEDLVKQHEADVEWIKEALRQIAEKAEGFASKEDMEKVLERLDNLEKTDKNLDKRLKDAETKLKDLEPRVKKLEANVGALWDHIKVAENQLAKIIPVVWGLTTDVKAIQDYLRSQVTGLIVQGTYNPLFGTFSIPANVQSNVLIAFYGKPKTKVEFPTTDDANYVRKKEVLTAKDWEMIGDEVEVFKKAANTKLFNQDSNGNASAGKVYVTVNPTSFDATGLKLDIVNTLDEVSPITLSPLQKSNATLQFGFSRADNGFYEANASIAKEDFDKVELAFDEAKLEEAIVEVRAKLAEMADNFFNTTGASGDLGGLATQVYNVIHDMRIDRSGLKCPYKDVDGNDNAIYSQYNIAATVLRPLSLASFKDIHYETIPGYEDMNDFINSMANTLKDHVHVLFTDANGSWKIQELFNGLEIDGVSLADYADDLLARLEVKTSSFTVNGLKFNMEDYNDGRVWLKFDKDLKIGGATVNIPAGLKYDSDEVNIDKTTLVIQNNPDDPSKLQGMIVVRANDESGKKTAYVCITLDESTLKAEVVSGKLQVTTVDGTFDVATISGSNLTPTSVEYIYLHKILGQGTVNIPFVTEIIGDAQKIIDELRQLTFELNETLGKINNYESVANGWIDDFIADYLKKYLNKINHTTVYFFNSVNRRFGPFMVASNEYKGFKRLSTNVYIPTELEKTGLNLYPTTKNMELLVPIARKHVAVTNVFDETGRSAQKDNDYALVTALKNANASEMFNTVIDGTERTINAEALTPGYTYEIAYSVLDFEGNISTQKYYIKITK